MKFFILGILLSLFVFVNSLYYCISLVCFVLLCLNFLFSMNALSAMVSLMLSLIYVGAVMIFIGYICAVCPNILVKTSYSFSFISFLMLFFVFFNILFFSPDYGISSLVVFFYGSGFLVFFLMVFMLFLVLLMVTTHFLNPTGPFRSLS